MINDIDIDGLSLDPQALRVSQARLLFDRARGSGLSVFAIVCLYSAILTFSAPLASIAIWFVAAVIMIGITLLLPAIYDKAGGITDKNAGGYLAWHTFISCLTGCVWGFGVVGLTDLDAQLSVFTTSMMVLGITLGGVSPQSAYRRSYVGLATFVMLPYAAFLLLWADWPISATGGGILLGYAFFMSSSARVETATHDALAVKSNQTLMAELRRQRDELQKVSEDKTRFLAATSHDLAQPLHAQGFYLAALREKLADPSQLDLLNKVEASWRGIGNLLDGLIDVSRLDAGAIVADFRDIDLAALVERVVDEYAAVAVEKNIRLTKNVVRAFARTDPILISRVLRNLLSNAIKFTDPGGTVSVTVLSEENNALVVVEDTGAGIPTDQHEAVFDEYVQLGNRERKREKGLGLGLSIVRRLTKMLQVILDFESTKGVGTVFRLTIPGVAGEGMLPDGQEALCPTNPSSIGNLSILIVDDEDAIRTGMSTLLSSWGAQTYTAASGDDLVDLLNQIDVVPDVLIVDQRLAAEETGHHVIEKLRDEVNEEVPVILMTGDIAIENQVLSLKGVRLLRKPVEPTVLHEHLMDISRENQLLRTLS